MNLGWEHSVDTSRSFGGSNEAGIELFKGDPITNFAREGVQNSYDAKKRIDGEGAKVRIFLELNKVGKDSIPGISELENNFKNAFSCFNRWYPDSDEKSEKFYNKALATLSQPELVVFQLSDSNTSGMNYIEGEMDNKLHRFIKSSGVSGKEGGSLGSFGIGKSASFAVSNLRTIFVSTAFDSDSGREELTQGKCMITSFEKEDKHHVGLGYWGIRENCEPVSTNNRDVPDWIKFDKEETTGTKISIIGFNEDYKELWQEKMSLSIVASFFSPIFNEKLEINIGDNYIWNKSTIIPFLDGEIFTNRVAKIGQLGNSSAISILNDTKDFLSVLTDNDVLKFEDNVPGVGSCSLKVKVSKDLPCKVCFFRDGIKITDDLKAPGLKKFTGLKDFVAIFECLDEKGNNLLRSIENPSHDNFEPSRGDNKQEVAIAEAAINNIGSWVRKKLNESCKVEALKERDIEDMLEFFSYEEEGNNNGDDDSNEINPFDDTEIIIIPPKVKRPVFDKPDAPPKPPPPLPPPNPHPHVPPSPRPKADAIEIFNPRLIKSSDKQFILSFDSEYEGDVTLNFFASGEDLDERVFPKSINGKKYNKDFSINLSSGERTKLEMEFEQESNFALIIKAYEITK